MATKKAKSAPAKKTTSKSSGCEYVILRGYRSGVHAGYMVKEEGGWITLSQARRIWYWTGAASLSEIAVYGCNPDKASGCKFAAAVANHKIKSEDVSEVIECTDEARVMIQGVPEWRA